MTTIIGGGSAGLFYAWKLLQQSTHEKVTIIEEHKEIGKPVQCTGILTDEIYSLIPKKDVDLFTTNKITKTTIFSPNKKINIPLTVNPIIDNVSFIKYLRDKAVTAGATIRTEYKYVKNEGKNITIRNTKTKKLELIKDTKLVGADGPASLVAKNNQLYKKREFLTGVQARIKLKDFDSEKIDFYPYIGEYAWFVPESENIVRVGVAARNNAKKIFDDFTKKYSGKIVEIQGGPIPLHKPKTSIRYSNKKFSATLIGDSALQIKNTTGGGIIPGLKAGLALSNNFEKYNKQLGKLNKELYLHYLLNKLLNKYSFKDWDRLIEKVDKPNIKEVIMNTNRDNPIKLLTKLMRPELMFEGLIALTKLMK